MALNAATVFEMREAGNANGGGGFVTGASGSDYSQQDAIQISRTDLVIDAVTNTNITSAATPFTTAEIGNVIRIHAGTGFTTGWYEITAVNGSNVATLDRSAGTLGSTGGSGNVGGAISTFQDAFFETLEPGNKVWIKAGTYTLAAGMAVAKDGNNTAQIVVEGYNTTRGDDPLEDNRPLIVGGSNNLIWDDYWVFKNFRITTANTNGFLMDTGGLWINCKVVGTSTRCITSNGTVSFLVRCEIEPDADSTTGVGGTCKNWQLSDSYIHSNNASTIGFGLVNSAFSSISRCIFAGLATAVEARAGGNNGLFDSNTIYGAETPAGTGLSIIGKTLMQVQNNIFYGLTTAITSDAVYALSYVDYNNFYNNTTNRTNFDAGDNDIALDPEFTDAASGDFSVGTNMKAAGFPGVFPGGLSQGYLDIGAVQREEPAAGGGGRGPSSRPKFLGGGVREL